MDTVGLEIFLKRFRLALAILLSCALVKGAKAETLALKGVSGGKPTPGVRYANFIQDEFAYVNITPARKMLVERSIQCALSCLDTLPCFSFNLAAFQDNNDKLLCEQLPSDKYNNSDQFVASKVFHHFSILSPCSSWPCSGNGKCVPLYAENGYVCICKTGFIGENCENDIDECSAGNSCDRNAVCANTEGSYYCTCKGGYTGDGRNCTDIDECSAGNSCDRNAVCANTEGSYYCTCKAGYTGDGRNCTDVDECSEDKNKCSREASCTNIEGSYNCTCKEGFFGDGRKCTPSGAKSCKHIRDMNVSYRKEDGYYWIDPSSNGTYLKVFCDMTTDGGGWLLVSKVVMQNSKPPTQAPLETSYRGIASNHMLLTKTAINQLRTHMNFTQLRFHCKKQTSGRTFHITTAANSLGEAVVQYFSGQTDVLPYACGSFVKMNDDNSRLAERCHVWGKEYGRYRVGKWGHENFGEDRLYNHPAFYEQGAYWLLGYNGPFGDRFECDDKQNEKMLSANDFWKIYAR